MSDLPPANEAPLGNEQLQEQLQEVPPEVGGGDYAPSVVERFALFQRAGGVTGGGVAEPVDSLTRLAAPWRRSWRCRAARP